MGFPLLLEMMVSSIVRARRNNKDIDELGALPDEVLADLGITRSDIQDYVKRGRKLSGLPASKNGNLQDGQVIYRAGLCCPA